MGAGNQQLGRCGFLANTRREYYQIPWPNFSLCFQIGGSCLTEKIRAPGGISESAFLYESIQDRKPQYRIVLDLLLPVYATEAF